MSTLGRLLTAMVTPFDVQGRVDLDEAVRVARHLVAHGNDGVVVAGTTGESPTLSDDEKLALFAAVKAALGDSATVIAGTGGNDTRHAVALTARAQETGVDGILAVVPYYNKPPQDGLIAHFGAIAAATTLPVMVYNIPARTGTNILPATVFALAERHANIVGVKESSGDLAQFTALLAGAPRPDFRVWCGDDHLFLPALAIGAHGLVSVVGHVVGDRLRALLEAFLAGDVAGAAAIHRELAPICAGLFSTTSPIPVKWAMAEFAFAVGACRPPLGALPAELQAPLRELIAPYRT